VLLSSVLLSAARCDGLRDIVSGAPLSRGVGTRFIAGQRVDEALLTAHQLAGDGLKSSIDRLGEDTVERSQADATRNEYVRLLDMIAQGGLARSAEVSLKLSAVGQSIPNSGERMALDNARTICAAARRAGTTVTLDMEDHTTTDSTLSILSELRSDFPETGAVLQASLLRTEGDCRDLAYIGSRVRLCKGAYREPASVARRRTGEIRAAYMRCLAILLAGGAYPMIASHDPVIVDAALQCTTGPDGSHAPHEFQMLFGVRPLEQARLVSVDRTVRVYLPYGDEWWGYMVRRMAEKPSNFGLFLRALRSTT